MNDEQQQLLDMYKAVAKIFDDHGIRYFGMYGTELGAIRHNGFIPWDNDIDLIVFSDDIPYINELMDTELDKEKYYYHYPRADCHPHVILKTDDFVNDLKEQKPIFLDLFLFHPYPDRWFRRKFFNLMATASYITTYMLESAKTMASYRLFNKVPRVFEKLALMVIKSDHQKVAHFVPEFRKDIFEIDDFREPLFHKFEDTVMPIPMDWEKYLLKYFGETYMTPPPPDKRTGAMGYPVGAHFDYILDSKLDRQWPERIRDEGVTVSIIIPLYNSENFVYECVRHVKQQSYENIEVVFVVDTRSDDGTYEKVVECSKSLKNVKIIEQKDDKRSGGARNIGLDSATGEYVWFMDVDDCPSPFFISEMLETALEYKSEVVACNHYYSHRNMIITPPDRNFRKTALKGKEAVRDVCLGKIAIPSWNKLFKTTFLRKNRIRFTSKLSEDYDHTIRSFLAAEKVIYYNKPLYTYVLAEGTRSANVGDKIAIADVRETMRAAKDLENQREAHDKFCAQAFRHLLHSLTNTSSETFSTLSKSDDVKYLSKFKQEKTNIEVILYRISPFLYYRIGRVARKIKFSNDDFLFDRNI
ncbi:MAG: glycosyltransferase [Candidatus Methanomethylophilaceae archaeon]|nr:glycosyltransferase [Candidatus Methanomethylophilaceae archaeon]